MRTLFVSLLFVMLMSCNNSASDKCAVPQQFTDRHSPELSGFDSYRLQRIDSVMALYVRTGVMPNAVSFVARNGNIVHHKAYGYRDVENKIPLKNTDIFRWASQTKAITTAVLLTLFEENKFMLDEPIERYLPMFANPRVYVSGCVETGADLVTRPATRSITVRHLLTHTAGYSYDSFGENLRIVNYAEPITTKEKIERIARIPLMHDPGERYTYGFATDIVGYLAEVLSGKTLDVLMRERIFEPLGMNDTYFYLPENKHYRLVKMYTRTPDGPPYTFVLDAEEIEQIYPLFAQPFHGGGAGLVGPIKDYAKFCQMILNMGEFNNRRILGRKTVELMIANHMHDIPGNSQFSFGYDIGTERDFNRNMRTVGSLSWGGLYGTSYLIDPKENMIFLFYTNVRNWSNPRVAERFRIAVHQAMIK